MAQPQPRRHEEQANDVDLAVARLEQAFQRLERTVDASRRGLHSLKEDNQKLNLLLHDADGEIGRLREAVFTVSERLDRTIGTLEEQA